MRTTLDIDEDVLLAAKELAARERRSLGTVVFELGDASPLALAVRCGAAASRRRSTPPCGDGRAPASGKHLLTL